MAVRSSSLGDIPDSSAATAGADNIKQDPDDVISESSQKTTQTDPQHDLKRRRFRPMKALRKFFGGFRKKTDHDKDTKKKEANEKKLLKKKERHSSKSKVSKSGKKHRDSDEGLSRSCGDSVSRTSTGERMHGRMKRDSGADSGASLLSINSDNEEMMQCFFGTSHGDSTASSGGTTKADLEFVSNSSATKLGNDAAHHKRAIAPKQRRAQRTRVQRAPSRTSDLPSTCEVSEDDVHPVTPSSRPFDLHLSPFGSDADTSISPLFSPSDVARFTDFSDLESTINKEFQKLKLSEKEGLMTSSCVKVEVHSTHTERVVTGATQHTEEHTLRTCDVTNEGSVLHSTRDETHNVSDRRGDSPAIRTVSHMSTSTPDHHDDGDISEIHNSSSVQSSPVERPLTSTPVTTNPAVKVKPAHKKRGFISRLGLNIGGNKTKNKEQTDCSEDPVQSSPWKKPLRRTIGTTTPKNDKPTPINKTQRHSSCEIPLSSDEPSKHHSTDDHSTPANNTPAVVSTTTTKPVTVGAGDHTHRPSPAPKPSLPPKLNVSQIPHSVSKSSSQIADNSVDVKPMFPIRKIDRSRSPTAPVPSLRQQNDNRATDIELKIKSRSLERGGSAEAVPSWVAVANAKKERVHETMDVKEN